MKIIRTYFTAELMLCGDFFVLIIVNKVLTNVKYT